MSLVFQLRMPTIFSPSSVNCGSGIPAHASSMRSLSWRIATISTRPLRSCSSSSCAGWNLMYWTIRKRLLRLGKLPNDKLVDEWTNERTRKRISTVRYARIPDEEGAPAQMNLFDLIANGITDRDVDQSAATFVCLLVVDRPLFEMMSETRNTMKSYRRWHRRRRDERGSEFTSGVWICVTQGEKALHAGEVRIPPRILIDSCSFTTREMINPHLIPM